MPKIRKITPPQIKKIQVPIDEKTIINIEYDGETARASLGGSKISEAGGTWKQWCFNIRDYEVCIDREELERS